MVIDIGPALLKAKETVNEGGRDVWNGNVSHVAESKTIENIWPLDTLEN